MQEVHCQHAPGRHSGHTGITQESGYIYLEVERKSTAKFLSGRIFRLPFYDFCNSWDKKIHSKTIQGTMNLFPHLGHKKYHLITYQQQVPWILGTKEVEQFALTIIQPPRTSSAVLLLPAPVRSTFPHFNGPTQWTAGCVRVNTAPLNQHYSYNCG